jgi:hypothetical protein
MKLPWPFRHIGLKALSIAFATILWLAVSGDETVERGLRVPLEFQQFPAGLEMMGEAPSLVDVRVRGASATLSQLGAISSPSSICGARMSGDACIRLPPSRCASRSASRWYR